MKETLEEAAESRFGTDMDSIRGSAVYDLNTDLKRGFIEGVKSDAAKDYWCAKWQAEKTKKTIFDKVDYKLLVKQKMLLIDLNNTDTTTDFSGLIHFLDAFQDEAVDMHGKLETEVFHYIGGEDLEKVAEKILANNIDGLRDALKDDDLFFFYKGVIQCYGESMAKWQQERSYSEEEVRRIASKAFLVKSNNETILEDFNKWFNQYKKK